MSDTRFLYGIANCDTVKKAKKWLDNNQISYQFIDFKKQGANPEDVCNWIERAGIGKVLNKRGTTWRKLSAEQQEFRSQEEAVNLICENPTLIKRPVLVDGETLEIGFKENNYQAVFK